MFGVCTIHRLQPVVYLYVRTHKIKDLRQTQITSLPAKDKALLITVTMAHNHISNGMIDSAASWSHRPYHRGAVT